MKQPQHRATPACHDYLRRLAGGLLMAAVLAGCSTTDEIRLQAMGSFFVGGREAQVSGKPVKEMLLTPGGAPVKVDPNGTYQVEQAYVQYFIPAQQRGQLPLLLWHGGALTGAEYETTPDGREGWLNWFVRHGWAVYNADAVERGRAGWAMYPDIFSSDPVFVTKGDPFERFRIGAGAGSYNKDPAQARLLPGSQFPLEGYDNFTKQIVPRWTTTDAAILKAYIALVDKVCPCVVLAHSQAGQFGYRAAQARPDKIKALVLVEPSAQGDPQQAATLRDMPLVSIYGDFIAQDARWPTIKANNLKFYETLRAAGGHPEVINLPEIGIHGNGHMMMMEKNNQQIAEVINNWLKDKGLYR